MWTVGRCIVYIRIRLLLLICPFISSVFFLSNFQTLQVFVTLFSGTVRPRRLKLGTHMDSGQMYCVYWNQAADAYSSLYFFMFLSLQFSNIIGIPVMRYERAARPCALNFRLAALKCRFGRPPNALSSVCVWPSMPPLCASFIQNVITLTGHLFIGKKCGISKHSYLSINLKLFR